MSTLESIQHQWALWTRKQQSFTRSLYSSEKVFDWAAVIRKQVFVFELPVRSIPRPRVTGQVPADTGRARDTKTDHRTPLSLRWWIIDSQAHVKEWSFLFKGSLRTVHFWRLINKERSWEVVNHKRGSGAPAPSCQLKYKSKGGFGLQVSWLRRQVFSSDYYGRTARWISLSMVSMDW